jgi:ClpP class serine protease
MAPAQREQLQSLLEATYQDFVATIAAARNKEPEEVRGGFTRNRGCFTTR